MQGENRVFKYLTVCGLAVSGMMISTAALAQVVDVDQLAEEKFDSIVEEQGQGKEIKPQMYNKTVIDNVAKYKAKQKAKAGLTTEAEDLAKLDAEDKADAKTNQAAEAYDAAVEKNTNKKSETLLDKVRAEREKKKEEATKEPLKSSRAATLDQREKERLRKEERRNMTRQESRETQLELRQLEKERKEERREIRKNTTREERREIKNKQREEEKLRRQNYKLEKEKRKEMRRLNK